MAESIYAETFYAETFSERMDRARDQLDPERHAYASRYTVLPRCRVLLTLSTGQVAKLWGVTPQQVRHVLKRGGIPGAKRSKKGKGTGWDIPAKRGNDGVIGVECHRGERGKNAPYFKPGTGAVPF
jgi:hypothetical protein